MCQNSEATNLVKRGPEDLGGSTDIIYCTAETNSAKFGSDWQLLSSWESRWQRHFPIA